MDDLEKWMIIRFTPHQTNTFPKWMSFLKHFLKSSLPLNLLCSIQVRPATISDDLYLPFCEIHILWLYNSRGREEGFSMFFFTLSNMSYCICLKRYG